MPLTEAFSVSDDLDTDDKEFFGAENTDSILDHFVKYFDEVSLRWHYRSQHENLILFSNTRFYEKELVIPPSVFRSHDKLGVKWHFIPDGKYHTGLNEREAFAIVQHLIEHIRANAPLSQETQESIGVVAMNIKQQMLIQELFDNMVVTDGKLSEDYHSKPVARDRDRLREEILRARGWEIYRIWSTDWYKNRRTEIERLEKYLIKLA